MAEFHQKNSERLLKNLKNTTGDYFFSRTLYIMSCCCKPCTVSP